MTSLTRELKKPDSPIARHLLDRFPNVRDLQRRYTHATAELAPIEPRPGASIAYSTLGTAFDWQVRFLVHPTPDLHLAFTGARLAGDDLLRVFGGLMAEVGATLTQATRSDGLLPPRWTAPADGRRAGALGAERLARVCWALALFTEVYRSGLAPGSPLDLLTPAAGLDELLALAGDDEIADLLALTAMARRVLVPALAERGGPVHVGPTFAGSADIAADADLIAGGLLLECKVNLGDRRDGRRRCSLARLTIHELLGYLLLDYHDAYRVEALGVYSARYAHLAAWPLTELLAVLAGGPVDLARARAEFREVVLATPNPLRDRRARMQTQQPRRTR